MGPIIVSLSNQNNQAIANTRPVSRFSCHSNQTNGPKNRLECNESNLSIRIEQVQKIFAMEPELDRRNQEQKVRYFCDISFFFSLFDIFTFLKKIQMKLSVLLCFFKFIFFKYKNKCSYKSRQMTSFRIKFFYCFCLLDYNIMLLKKMF